MAGMRINFYYLAHGFFVMNPRQIADDYREIKDLGADSLTYAILEQDEEFCPATVEMHFAMAHKAGLKVYVIFSRFGGLFAGAPRVPSLFATNNPEVLMRNENGGVYGGDIGVVACVNNPKFAGFFDETTARLLSRFEIDGVVLDEPKVAGMACHCDACRRLRGEADPLRFQKESFAGWLGRIITNMKRQKPGLEVALFNDTLQDTEFHEMTAKLAGLDYHGIDGSLSLQGVDPKRPGRTKMPLLDQLPEAKRIAHSNGKKLMAVCENFQVPASQIPAWEASFAKVLEFRPELLVFFHYAPNTDDPEALQEMVRRCCRKAAAAGAGQA